MAKTVEVTKVVLQSDVTATLAQLGRFDLVTLLLAIVTLLIALVGVFAFLNLRSIARKHAFDEASRIAKETAEKEINLYIQKELPNLLQDYKGFGDNTSDDLSKNVES